LRVPLVVSDGIVINLVIALLIIVVVGYAIANALGASLAAEERAAARNAAHRQADELGYGDQRGSRDGEGRGAQGIDAGTEL
jgi:hypothetical protein